MALIKCLRLMKSIGAQSDNLMKAFVDIVEDAKCVEKLQIKQLLTALNLIFSHEDNFFRDKTSLLKVCQARL